MTGKKSIISVLKKGPRKFTELKEETGLENGVIQHHVNSSDEIVKRKDALMLKDECSNCALKNICQSKCITAFLKDPMRKNIARKIDDNSQASIAREIDLSRPTVNYHVSRLSEANILQDKKLRPEAKSFLEK